MARESKFKTGMKVKSHLNNFDEYEIVEVLRNELIVSPTTKKDLKFRSRKALFEVIEK